MRNPRSVLVIAAALAAAVLLGSGCKMHRKDGIFSQNPTPSMGGSWAGSMNYTYQGSTTPVVGSVNLVVTQDTMNIDGTFTAPAGQSSLFGVVGTVSGVTTGHSFLVTLTPDDPLCHASLQIGGTNDGAEMQYSVSGVDCSSVTFTGQGYFNKQH